MITILMPISNGMEFIQESVHSILNQSFSRWELLIGINGHPPNSIAYSIAKQFASDKVKVFDLPQFSNKCDTLNHLVKLASYDWIALLDVDDIWLPDKLRKQVPYMDNYDVIGTKGKYFGRMTQPIKVPTGDITGFDFLSYNPIINSSCLVRKELCFWDKKWFVEDYHLWLTLWKQGRRFYNVETIEVLHRIHPTSAFNTKDTTAIVAALKQSFR